MSCCGSSFLQKDECIHQTKTIFNIKPETAKEMITENMLCTGGPSQNYIDDVTCKGNMP